MNLSKTLVLVFIEIVGGCRDYEQCYLMYGFAYFCNRLEKVTDENERISEELKFKEQKVQSLQRRLVQNISFPDICFDLKTYRFFCISWN